MSSAARVLVAANDAAMLETIGFILIDAGYHVVLAWSGHVAQHRLAAFHPTVIILDTLFRIEDELALEVLRKRLSPETLIIALGISERLRDLAIGMGANEFMVKPFDKATLLDYVGKYINKPTI